MNLNLLIGASGTTLILIGFLLNQMDIWSNDSLSYDLINLIGSSILIFYALILGSIPFIILNAVWATVSLKDVIKDLK